MSYLNDRVHSTTEALLSVSECTSLIAAAEKHAKLRGGWSTQRHYAVPTTDLPLHDIPFEQQQQQQQQQQEAAAAAGAEQEDGVSSSGLVATTTVANWFREVLLDGRLRTTLVKMFGETLVGPSGEDVLVHDAFLVKYHVPSSDGDDDDDEKKVKELSRAYLPLHYDESALSFTIALNGDFQGGGTYFADLGRAVEPRVGHVLAFRGDRCFHGGAPITSGTRYIIAAFCWGRDKTFWGEKDIKSIIEGERGQRLDEEPTDEEERQKRQRHQPQQQQQQLFSFSFD